MLDRMKHALKSSIETSDHERFNLLIKDMYPIDIADFLSVHSDQILITFLKYTSPDLHAKVLEQAMKNFN